MAQDSFTGKAGCLALGGALVITKWTSNTKVEYAKTTDSSNYDTASGRLSTAQTAGEESLEVEVEGHFSTSTSPAILGQMFSPNPVAGSLGFTRTINFCSGNFNVSEFKTGVVVDGANTVDFTCKLLSNGKISYVGT